MTLAMLDSDDDGDGFEDAQDNAEMPIPNKPIMMAMEWATLMTPMMMVMDFSMKMTHFPICRL